MTSPATKRLPADRLPPLQRPTPSRCIRLHLDTHAQLAAFKVPGMSFDGVVLELMRHWRTCILGPEYREKGP